MANRPSKKSSVTAGASGRPNASSLPAGAGALKGDDRNLVIVDKNFADADLEDKAWLFWQRRRSQIIGGVAALAIVVVLMELWNVYQQHEASRLEAAYQAADGPVALLAVAQTNPTSDIGKIAMLEAADAYYKNGQFKDAADTYEKALGLWGSDPQGQRARVGQALSLVQSGEADKGKQLLEGIVSDNQVLDNYRAESAYYLAVIAIQGGDGAEVSRWIERVNTLEPTGPWANQAAGVADLVPVVTGINLQTSIPTLPGAGQSSANISPSMPMIPASTAPTPLQPPAGGGVPTTVPAPPVGPAPAPEVPLTPAPAAPTSSSPAAPASSMSLPGLLPTK